MHTHCGLFIDIILLFVTCLLGTKLLCCIMQSSKERCLVHNPITFCMRMFIVYSVDCVSLSGVGIVCQQLPLLEARHRCVERKS